MKMKGKDLYWVCAAQEVRLGDAWGWCTSSSSSPHNTDIDRVLESTFFIYGEVSHFIHPADIRSGDCVFSNACENSKSWVSERHLKWVIKRNEDVWVRILCLLLDHSKILGKLFKLSLLSLFSSVKWKWKWYQLHVLLLRLSEELQMKCLSGRQKRHNAF